MALVDSPTPDRLIAQETPRTASPRHQVDHTIAAQAFQSATVQSRPAKTRTAGGDRTMAFRHPTFNLVYHLWRAWDFTQPAPALVEPTLRDQPGALWLDWKTLAVQNYPVFGQHNSVLVAPAKADLRGPHPGVLADCVEVPAGSLRFYQVITVDDAHKLYDNEYRVAVIASQESVPGYWKYPIP